MGDTRVKPFNVKALFDFSDNDFATVPLKKGDIFKVYRIQDEWMYGVGVNGKSGFFPAIFVETSFADTHVEVDLGFTYTFIGPDLCRVQLTEEFGLGHIVIKVPNESKIEIRQECVLAKLAVKRAKPSHPAPPLPSSPESKQSSAPLASTTTSCPTSSASTSAKSSPDGNSSTTSTPTANTNVTAASKNSLSTKAVAPSVASKTTPTIAATISATTTPNTALTTIAPPIPVIRASSAPIAPATTTAVSAATNTATTAITRSTSTTTSVPTATRTTASTHVKKYSSSTLPKGFNPKPELASGSKDTLDISRTPSPSTVRSASTSRDISPNRPNQKTSDTSKDTLGVSQTPSSTTVRSSTSRDISPNRSNQKVPDTSKDTLGVSQTPSSSTVRSASTSTVRSTSTSRDISPNRSNQKASDTLPLKAGASTKPSDFQDSRGRTRDLVRTPSERSLSKGPISTSTNNGLAAERLRSTSVPSRPTVLQIAGVKPSNAVGTTANTSTLTTSGSTSSTSRVKPITNSDATPKITNTLTSTTTSPATGSGTPTKLSAPPFKSVTDSSPLTPTKTFSSPTKPVAATTAATTSTTTGIASTTTATASTTTATMSTATATASTTAPIVSDKSSATTVLSKSWSTQPSDSYSRPLPASPLRSVPLPGASSPTISKSFPPAKGSSSVDQTHSQASPAPQLNASTPPANAFTPAQAANATTSVSSSNVSTTVTPSASTTTTTTPTTTTATTHLATSTITASHAASAASSAVVSSSAPSSPASTPTASRGRPRTCIVLHPFHQKDSSYTMLSLEVGDVVTILRDEGEWLEGECKGAIGYVPRSFVKEDAVQEDTTAPTTQFFPPSRTSCQTPEPHESAASPRLKSVMAELDRALLELKLDNPSPRTLSAIELVETERRYVEDLQILQHAILLPLQKSASELNESKGFVDTFKRKLQGSDECANVNAVVAQWSALCSHNVPFLAAMQACVQQWHSLSEKDHIIGSVLLDHLPKFTSYGKYCAQYYFCHRVLMRVLNKHGKFSRVRKNADESGLLQNRTISSYLISPIQRVPRYQMLIGELLKCTPVDHADYAHLQEALKIVMEVGRSINESVRIQENHELIVKLESTFDVSPNFSAQPHQLLHYADLIKLSDKQTENGVSDFSLRTFFLFDDMLAYARVKAVGDKMVLRNRFAINSYFEIVDSSTPLQITIKSVKSLTLVFQSIDEKTKWLTDLQKCLAQQTAKSQCGYCKAELPISSLTKCTICYSLVCSSCSRMKMDVCCLACYDFNKLSFAQRKSSVLSLRAPRKPAFSVTSQQTKTITTDGGQTPSIEFPTEKEDGVSVLDCPQGHGLSLIIALREGYGCDACGLEMEIGERMQSCVACNYFVCVACQQRPGVTLKLDSTQMEIAALIEKARVGFLDRFIQGVLDEDDEGSQVPAETSPTAVPAKRKVSLRDLRQRIQKLPEPTSLAVPSVPSTSPPRSLSPHRILQLAKNLRPSAT